MRRARRPLAGLAVGALLSLALPLGLAGADVLDRALPAEPTALIRTALELACAATGRADLDRLARRLPDVAPIAPSPQSARLIAGARRVYDLPDGRLTVEWLAPRGDPNHLRLQFDLPGRRPHLFVLVDPACQVHTARRIRYDAAGHAQAIEHLDQTLAPSGREEPIDPPIPAYPDFAGVPVALIDTGVNYTLPAIAARLARAADGRLLGYDFWDLDERPFDINLTRSPFFPGRHGTEVASLVIAEAPVARLLPYRFPRPDMRRLGELVEQAAADGARLANLSLASFNPREWDSFLAAVDRHPEILFVVAAGNHRRDLDRHPVYPAAAKRPNLVTVTAGDVAGALANGVNWGRRSVDLMAPAGPVAVLDFDGASRLVTGSSYATARVTALAACLAAAHPDWSALQLKARLFALARRPAEPDRVGVGFLPARLLGRRQSCMSPDP